MTVTTRITARGHRFARRAVFVDGKAVGYTVSHLGAHQAFLNDGTEVKGTEHGGYGYGLLRVATADLVTAATV